MRNDSTEMDDNDATNSLLEFQGLKCISSHKTFGDPTFS